MALNENPTLTEIVDEVERLNELIIDRGGAKTITPTTSNQVLNKGNYKGNITVKGDSNLVSSNIVSGKSIFGVSGSATVSSLGGKRCASGTSTVSSEQKTFTYVSKSTGSSYYITIPKSNIPFTPRYIIVECATYRDTYQSLYVDDSASAFTSSVRSSYYGTSTSSGSYYSWLIDSNVKTSSQYTIPVRYTSNGTYRWIAFE